MNRANMSVTVTAITKAKPKAKPKTSKPQSPADKLAAATEKDLKNYLAIDIKQNSETQALRGKVQASPAEWKWADACFCSPSLVTSSCF